METERHWATAPLPWQMDNWQQLLPLVESSKLPHALMVAGPAGIGKRRFLEALAALVLCQQPAAGTACGSCRACTLLDAGSHTDLLSVSTEEDSRVIKIDQVRALIDFAARTPALGERKVILLGPAEQMNINAANAVLKCLEEPSPSTLILLYSHQPSSLPATVRSRCQSLVLATPAVEQARDWLTQQLGQEQLATQLLDCSAGRPLAAMELFHSDGLDSQLAVRKGLQAVLQGKLSALEFPQLVADMELGSVLRLLQDILEQHLRSQTSAGDRLCQRRFLLRDQLARLQLSIANGANPNRQLLVEDCVAQLTRVVGVNAA
ncbi:MAG: DNA polymerase III subunit delta' [Halieaceae bacterium]